MLWRVYGLLRSTWGNTHFPRAFASCRRQLLQEDPFKLVILAKDVQPHCVAYADFIFSSDGQFYVITGDEDGVIRLYEYDPSGMSGITLLCTLFDFACRPWVPQWTVSTLSIRISWTGGLSLNGTDRSPAEGWWSAGSNGTPHQWYVLGMSVDSDHLKHSPAGAADGSMYSVTPVEDATMKRMQVLQGQLSRNMQHVAGLNPKAFYIQIGSWLFTLFSLSMIDALHV